MPAGQGHRARSHIRRSRVGLGLGSARMDAGTRTRVTLDSEDWIVVVELVKLRFAELVELGQTDETDDGTIRQEHRDAALELWPIIRDIELQLPTHKRANGKQQRIIGPLRSIGAALKKLGVPDAPIEDLVGETNAHAA